MSKPAPGVPSVAVICTPAIWPPSASITDPDLKPLDILGPGNQGDRTRQVAALLRTVTHNDHFIHHIGFGLQFHVNRRLSPDGNLCDL